MDNEIALCRECHTLIHAGLVSIERDGSGALLWIPKLREIEQFRNAKQHGHDLSFIDLGFRDLDAVGFEFTKSGAMGASSPQSGSCTFVSIDAPALIAGLQAQGYSEKEATSRIHGAIKRLQFEDLDLEASSILGKALRAKL